MTTGEERWCPHCGQEVSAPTIEVRTATELLMRAEEERVKSTAEIELIMQELDMALMDIVNRNLQ
jgi:hypothetical protein